MLKKPVVLDRRRRVGEDTVLKKPVVLGGGRRGRVIVGRGRDVDELFWAEGEMLTSCFGQRARC